MSHISKVSVRGRCHHLIRLMEENDEDPSYPLKLLSERSTLDLWVVLDNGDVVGALLAQKYAEDGFGGVENFIVDRRFRRRGIGREVMLIAERHYRDVGMERMRLTVRADNQESIPLYQSLGYKTVRRYNRPRDRQERLRMEKRLEGSA